MLNVTEAALDRLSNKLAYKKATADQALRVTRKPRGWKLRLDCSRPSDTAIAHDGKNVLLLDEAVCHAMRDMTLDVRAAKAGPRLTLR